METQVPQNVMEDAIAVWNRLQCWGNASNYLLALNNPCMQHQKHGVTKWDPYSIRLARRVVAVVERLDNHREKSLGLGATPREKLLALAEVVRLCLESFDPLGTPLVQGAAFPFKTPSSFLSPSPPVEWERAVDKRVVSGTMIMEGLHILTYPSVQLRIEASVEQLLQHIMEEFNGGSKRTMRHSPEELRALRATTMLLEDFDALYKRIVCVFPCVRMMGSPHIPVALLPIVIKLYYKMAEWVRDAEVTGELNSFAQITVFKKKKLFVKMRRGDKNVPWGLQFNDEGRVVQVNPSVRSGSHAAEVLHGLTQFFKKGLSIVELNSQPVSFANLTAKQATDKLHFWTIDDSRLSLTMQDDHTTPPLLEQLAFFVVPGAKKQCGTLRDGDDTCATLVLHRELCGISWDIRLTSELCVVDVPTSILSKEAATFFKTHHKQLRIGAINGVKVTRAYQVEALSQFVNTIVIDFYKVPPPETVPAQVKPKRVPALKSDTKNTPSQHTSVVVTATAVAAPETVKRIANDGKEQQLREVQTSKKKIEDSSPLDKAGGKSNSTTAIVHAKEAPLVLVSTVAEKLRSIARAGSIPGKNGANGFLEDAERRAVSKNDEYRSATKQNEVRGNRDGDVTTSLTDTVMVLDMDGAEPLTFPNNVTINMLTPEEMVVQRPSCEKKWGFSLETEGMYPKKTIHMSGLPRMLDEQWHHPFSKLFRSRKGEWRIASVNGTPASQLPEVIDVMKHALKMQIKFIRRW